MGAKICVKCHHFTVGDFCHVCGRAATDMSECPHCGYNFGFVDANRFFNGDFKYCPSCGKLVVPKK
jgi:RNA polymerase subunit RPABC4/transcription elongation factor Spt4